MEASRRRDLINELNKIIKPLDNLVNTVRLDSDDYTEYMVMCKLAAVTERLYSLRQHIIVGDI